MFVMQNLIELAFILSITKGDCAPHTAYNRHRNGRERMKKTEKIVMEHTVFVCMCFFIAYIHVLMATLIETDLLKQKLID